MLDQLAAIVVSDIVPVFAIAAVGFLLARLLEVNVKALANVVFYALLPCLVFRLLVTSHMSGPSLGRMAAFSVLVSAAMATIGLFAARLLRLDRVASSALLLVVMISNGGNFGLPVVLFAFGPEALAHASVFFVTSALVTNSVGVFIAAAGRAGARRALLDVARSPVIYAAAAALVIVGLGAAVPVAVMRPVGLLSDAALPMMILVLGMQLSRVKLPERIAPVAVAVALSLGVAPFVGLGLASLLGVSGAARQAGVLLAAMPVAVITTILALEFDLAPGFVTATVFVSTALSPLTLAPLIAYLSG